MTNLDVVISSTRSCLNNDCKKCYYYKKNSKNNCYHDLLLKDILLQLQSNQNRILTFEEITDNSSVFIEYNPNNITHNRVELAIPSAIQIKKDVVTLILYNGGVYDYKQDFDKCDYNVRYRCWKKRPTFFEMDKADWTMK